MQNLSDTERKILSLLQENARQSLTEIAQKIGTSRTNVKTKIDRLYDAGIIKRFTVDLEDADARNTGTLKSFFHVHLTEPACETLFDHVKKWEEVKGCWTVSSPTTDMIVMVEAISQEALESARFRISKLPYVDSMHTTFVLREWQHKL
ncbi:Lrp/AsnC family transcriptional regulator (plasmid) [Microbulbifer sp. MKSA007]|nr:Lrp/AsnC family transcriptional regulator [Microbulbifer sp. MKSA007]